VPLLLLLLVVLGRLLPWWCRQLLLVVPVHPPEQAGDLQVVCGGRPCQPHPYLLGSPVAGVLLLRQPAACAAAAWRGCSGGWGQHPLLLPLLLPLPLVLLQQGQDQFHPYQAGPRHGSLPQCWHMPRRPCCCCRPAWPPVQVTRCGGSTPPGWHTAAATQQAHHSAAVAVAPAAAGAAAAVGAAGGPPYAVLLPLLLLLLPWMGPVCRP
jgi:hypothetical protein